MKMSFNNIYKKLLDKKGQYLKRKYKAMAQNYIDSNKGLKWAIRESELRLQSCGVSTQDYAFLHAFIKANRFRWILECGSGRSTWVMAQALKELKDLDSNYDPKVISMDDSPAWHDQSSTYFPKSKYPFVEFRLSKSVTWQYGPISGWCYEEIPDHPYEFVYVDGPGERDMGNIDFVRVVMHSNHKVCAAIDSRKLSVMMYTLFFGPSKVCYFDHWGLGKVEPVSKDDMLLGFESRKKNEVLKQSGLFESIVNVVDGSPLKF